MCIKFEESKIHHSKRNTRFIQKRVHRKRKKIHQAQKGASALRQERILESASKGPKSIKLRKKMREKCPQNFIQSREKKKKRKGKKACQVENPKGRSRQKLRPKKKKKRKEKKVRQAENPKGRSMQKLGPKKRKEKGKILAN